MKDRLRQKLGNRLQANVSLKELNTYKIGGNAKFLIKTKNSDELFEVVKIVQELEQPFFLLAGGSNVLISDTGFDGVVIKIDSNNFEVKDNIVLADAGVNFNKLVNETAKAGLSGMEWMVGIYGTIGGAIRGNAGAYGHSISSLVEEVNVYKGGKVKKYSNKNCNFSYRNSEIKQNGGVILKVKLRLEKGEVSKIQEVAKETMLKRTQRIPTEPNPGSIFQNIPPEQIDKSKMMKGLDISEDEFNRLMKFGDFPAGYIIENLGFKGKTVGGAQVSEKHCNFIINKNNAKATDIVILTSMIKQKVRSKIGIQLHEEVQMVGF